MKVPTSIARRVPVAAARMVMKAPCSGPIWKVTRSGNRWAVSAIRSASSGSGGLLWPTRYSCSPGARCSVPVAMG